MPDRTARHAHAPPDTWTVTDGRPDEAERQTVLDAIAEAVDPDRIIVFGSAARGTMTAGSDVDLLIVKRTDDLRALRAAVRAALAANRRPVDVVAGTPRMLDEQRRCLSMVYGPALRDGIVAWARSARETTGAPAWSTLPERKGTSGDMIRTLRFRREEADTWIAKAREDLTVVNTTDAAIPFAPRAHSAQAATEKALKALLVAHGRPVPFDHDLNMLADLAIQQGEALPAVSGRDALEALSDYGGPAQHPHCGGDPAPGAETLFPAIANAVTAHAASRVDAIMRGKRRRKVAGDAGRTDGKGPGRSGPDHEASDD